MVSTRELRGSKEEIVEQLGHVRGRIVSAFIVVDEPSPQSSQSDEEEAAQMRAEMEADAVSAPHADDSRDAIYTRMPGE